MLQDLREIPGVPRDCSSVPSVPTLVPRMHLSSPRPCPRAGPQCPQLDPIVSAWTLLSPGCTALSHLYPMVLMLYPQSQPVPHCSSPSLAVPPHFP